MALSASTVWEVRNTADFAGASDTNSGGYVAGGGGTDWSQQGSPQYSVTDGVTAGTTTITSASANFGTDVVGNIISVSGGTGSVTQGWYQITTRNSATSITVDRATGLTSGTGVTLKIGGALATLGGLGFAWNLIAVSGMIGWIKYSTTAYSMTVATNNASGGIFTMPSAIALNLEGYDQSRGDRTGNRPQISWASVAAPGSATYVITTSGGARQRVSNISINGNSKVKVCGINISSSPRHSADNCLVIHCNDTAGIGFNIAQSPVGIPVTACGTSDCTVGFSGGAINGSIVDSCTAASGGTGFSNVSIHRNCLAYSNTVAGFSSTVSGSFNRCTSDNNLIGFTIAVGSGSFQFIGSIASNNTGGGGTGFALGTTQATLENCAAYNNASDTSGTALINEGWIPTASFSGSPYVNQASGDFRPNATAGAGALLRNGSIGVYGQTDNVDIGAVQHSDPAGSSSSLNVGVRMGGRM